MRIIICGRGGQGVITMNMLLGYLATALNHTAVSAETHGMAMRGGSVNTFLKINEGFSAAMEEGGADVLLSSDKREVERNIKYLRKGGLIITDGENLPDLPFEIICGEFSKLASEKFGGPSQTSSIIIGYFIGRFTTLFPKNATLNILKENQKINIDAIIYGLERVI